MNWPNKLVLLNTRLERFANDKHSNLMVQFVSYEVKEILWIPPVERIFNTSFCF